jgi:uncharacterized membrane protein YqjE
MVMSLPYLADGFTVSGVHGFLILVAFLLFAVSAVIAWVVEPRAVWATFVAAGLALFMLALLFGG